MRYPSSDTCLIGASSRVTNRPVALSFTQPSTVQLNPSVSIDVSTHAYVEDGAKSQLEKDHARVRALDWHTESNKAEGK